ncbi:MAG: hypothetical protein SV253_00015 [Halobacteria archaeon]|nr:hypothetical protein [Halobacteria archaeon]
MAYFGWSRSRCRVCGETGSLETDLFVENGLTPSRDDAETYCFGCYVDEVGRVGHIACLSLDDGRIVVGGTTAEDVESMTSEILGTAVDEYVTDTSDFSVVEAFEDDEVLSDYYLREVVRASGSEVWEIRRFATPSSVVDFGSFVSEETRERIRDDLLEDIFVDADLTEIERREDVEALLSERYPVLHRHRVTRGLEADVWRHVREKYRDSLADRTRLSVENQKKGRGFEEFFSDLCAERRVDCLRGREALREARLGDVRRRLEHVFGDVSGIPDFYVEGSQSRIDDWDEETEESDWRPEEPCFVEVKYGDSRMSKRQREVAEVLEDTGYGVYVLRGKPEEYVFERYADS